MGGYKYHPHKTYSPKGLAAAMLAPLSDCIGHCEEAAADCVGFVRNELLGSCQLIAVGALAGPLAPSASTGTYLKIGARATEEAFCASGVKCTQGMVNDLGCDCSVAHQFKMCALAPWS